MTIGTTVSAITTQGDGVTTAFVYPFRIPAASDATVIYTDIDGNQTTLLNSQFAISGLGLATGGTVIYPLSGSPIASGTLLTIERVLPLVQTASLSNQGPTFSAIENALDYLTMLDQQIQLEFSRTIQLNVADQAPVPMLPPAAQRAGNFLAFDSQGNPIVANTITGSVVVSAAMIPVVEAATTSDATALLTYLDPRTGGVVRSVASQFGDIVNVKNFGAIGDGVTNDTVAIQAALDAATVGGSVFFPPATYKVTGTLTMTIANVAVWAAGATISTASGTLDVLHLQAAFIEIADLTMTASVARTAGAFIHCENEANYTHLHDMTMTAFFNGVVIDGVAGGPTGIHISHSRFMLGTAGTSSGIIVNSGVDLEFDYLWIVGGPGANLANGVLVNACGDLTLDHVSTVYAGNGLSIVPAFGAVVQAVFATDCFFDSGSGNGINVVSAGRVMLLKLTSCWSAANTGDGLLLTTSGGGTVEQVDCVSCVLSANTLSGAAIGSAAVTSTKFIGCSAGGNLAYGIAYTVATNFITIIGCALGGSGEFGGNTLYGLSLVAGCQNMAVAFNIFNGNGSGPALIGAPGINTFVANNIGYETEASGLLTTTAGVASFTIGHGLSATPALQDISLQLCSSPGAATYFYATAPGATNFTITFNANPGAGVLVTWRIRTLGG